MTAAPRLTAALDDFCAWFYRAQPVSATFIGVHDFDHRLPDWSASGREEARAAIADLRRRFAGLPEEPSTEEEALDRHLAAAALEVLAWEASAPHFTRNPSAVIGEAVFGVIALLLRPFAPVAARAEAAVERMVALPAFVQTAWDAPQGVPRAWIERATRECEGALALFERGVHLFARDEHLAHPRWEQAAALAAEGVRRFRATLTAQLAEAPADGYACGAEALDRLIQTGHGLEMDHQEVLALGEEHLAEARARLEVLARRAGVDDWREGLRRLADCHPERDRYYDRYTELWEEAKAAAEAAALVTWPDYPVRYVPQPRWAREAAPALYFLFYRAPAPFDRLPVVDYFVPPIEPELPPEEQRRRLRAANDGVIKLNHVVHHGGLGHHVQNWYAYHRAGSRLGRVAAVDCASRIALFCGGTMAEGWATYATDLMEEVGYLTPLERLAQAHSRLRIAARAVVDVRLHTGAWTLEQAAAFYRDAAAMPEEAARAEAVKTSMFPGAALMYLAGNRAIHDLREALRARPGFSVRGFHDRLLSYGSVPVPLIARRMRAGDGRQ
jgi:uncharacterized protein (DUF885 family)